MVAGYSEVFSASDNDMWLIKISKPETTTTTTEHETTTTTTEHETTNTKLIPSWTPVIGLISITALIINRKGKKYG
ncbi:MAG: hypothetical protein ACXABI_06475 [Candidatus Hodarchaeales archaeon]